MIAARRLLEAVVATIDLAMAPVTMIDLAADVYARLVLHHHDAERPAVVAGIVAMLAKRVGEGGRRNGNAKREDRGSGEQDAFHAASALCAEPSEAGVEGRRLVCTRS